LIFILKIRIGGQIPNIKQLQTFFNMFSEASDIVWGISHWKLYHFVS